jgi:hypothetical protein
MVLTIARLRLIAFSMRRRSPFARVMPALSCGTAANLFQMIRFASSILSSSRVHVSMIIFNAFVLAAWLNVS